ncbi:MAG TPA: 30S ribosomal protein S6 [Deltaproteobacteria bacterium]|nr:30S ribosomal protein S6 [Deltaproteobacteria bacterium]HQI81996.1 30S ribosomal protein S6 [Deltaproteobacteria bacterium]
MNLYEIMFILSPDMGEEEREKFISRLNGTITRNKGEVIRLNDLGIKSMTYKIKKKSRGQYVLLYLEGPGAMVAEIERMLRIDENVIRFVVVKLDRHVTRQDLEPKAEPAPAQAEPTTQNEEVGA